MKMQIDDLKLELLLEKKKNLIGQKVVWEALASSLSLLISVYLSEFKDKWGVSAEVLKTFAIVLGLVFTALAVFDIIKAIRNRYSYEDLLSDINNLNEVEHYHSIVVIKDSFRDYSNRYLVYADKRWDCNLFINYKDNENNESFIVDHLSNELKIPVDSITLAYKATRVHDKKSESAGIRKLYSHKFYLATLDNFPDYMKSDSFVCDGKEYFWKTIADLEEDEEIKKKNLDVVSYVKELI